MLGGLFIVSLVCSCLQAIKEANAPVIPAENWANKKLYNNDVLDGISIEHRMENVKNGKYRMNEVPIVKYPEPHRTADGRIIIENNLLYKEDLRNYGAYQTYKWVEQGKYNLTSEELKKEHERQDVYWKQRLGK